MSKKKNGKGKVVALNPNRDTVKDASFVDIQDKLGYHLDTPQFTKILKDVTAANAKATLEVMNHHLKLMDKKEDAPIILDSALQKELKSKAQGKRKLIFENPHSPGDIVMMTAAIRDLHATYPGEYLTDVRCPVPEIWEGNPHITPLESHAADVVHLRAEYPLIHTSNEGSYHFIHGYRKHFEELIGRPIKQGKMKGDIYIRPEESAWISAIEEIAGDKRPFWVIDGGHKSDFTAKAWPSAWYQEVVDAFKDKIQFVQMGHKDHYHPPLKGVINLIGQTDVRQLIRLIYHAVGVLTPVSLPMVLAAAVPTSWEGAPKNRSCVVLSGGREPVQWQMYPNHQFLHSCGTMDCCDNGGCWMSRVVPLGDGDKSKETSLCMAPQKIDGQDIAGCMAAIAPEEVIYNIKRYYENPRAVHKYSETKTFHWEPGMPKGTYGNDSEGELYMDRKLTGTRLQGGGLEVVKEEKFHKYSITDKKPRGAVDNAQEELIIDPVQRSVSAEYLDKHPITPPKDQVDYSEPKLGTEELEKSLNTIEIRACGCTDDGTDTCECTTALNEGLLDHEEKTDVSE